MISEHFDAIKARLEADANLLGDVYDTVRADATGGLIRDNYVILYRSVPELIESGRVTAIATVASELTFTVDVRAVGTSATAVGAVMDRILTQLVGHRPVVAGRKCTALKVESSGRVTPDTSVKPFLYYADVGFEMISRAG